MTSRNSWLRVSGVALSSLLLAGTASAQTEGQTSTETNDTTELSSLIVSASRTPQDPKWVSSSVTRLSLSDLETSQTFSLTGALQRVPGLVIATSGAFGGQTSIMLRGASSHQVLFVVDGVRMNDRSTPYYNFLGGASLGGLDRLEVLRGPQGTLYGSTAIGGVILLETERGTHGLRGNVDGVFGSFNTFGGGLSVSGAKDKASASVHVDHVETDNQEPRNAYRQSSESSRVEYELNDKVSIGATVRAQQGTYHEIGSRSFHSYGIVVNDNTLVTAYTRVKLDETLDSKVTLAYHERHYTYDPDPAAGWNSDQKNRRKVIDWQTNWHPDKSVEVIGGVNYERSTYIINGAPGNDRVSAAFVSGSWRPLSNVSLNAGIRHDDFKSVGGATTGRAGVTYLLAPATKLRASWGTGFVAPGIDDRYGVVEWGQLANPNLKPEHANGWDVGIEQDFKEVSTTVSLTYFDTSFRDLFQWKSLPNYEGQITNVARAESSGVELAAETRFGKQIATHLSYSYLDARDASNQARLARRPRDIVSADLTYAPVSAWILGVGGRSVIGNFDGTALPSYTTLRFFSSYQLRRDLKLKARVENAFDTSFDEVKGYKAPGRAVYCDVEWSF